MVTFPPLGTDLHKGAQLKICSKVKTKALVFRDILFSYSNTQNVVRTMGTFSGHGVQSLTLQVPIREL